MEKAIQRYWPVFVLPTLLAFIIGFIWPFIWGVALSFCKFTTVQNVTFVGLGNYAKIWLDDTFTHAFWFTAVFTVVSTVLINVLAFGIALLLTRGIRGTNIFRTTFFMPNLIGGIILGYIWQILLNGVLSALEKPLLSLNATYGFLGLVILMCWQQIGYMMIIYIAGLQNVPLDLIEAAKIDGANAKQILFKIKIPMVMPSITICTFLTLTNSFKLFDQNLSLTGGEPAKQTMMLAYNIYDTLLAFIIGFIWPFIWGVALSFCKFTTVQNVTFVGLGNYAKIWLDDTFTHAFWFTAVFTVVSTVLINVLAFGIALLLTRGIRGTNIFRTTFFMPNLIGGIILGYIWQILLNGVLSALEKPLLSLNATYGFLGLVILMCWQQIGYMMIIYIAGLQNVPLDLIEAAKIDGANAKQILFKIKIPMVMPSITICTFLTLTNSFKLFDQNLSLTGGEPAKQTMMLAYNIYDTFYARSGPQWKGIGQAKAVVFCLFVVVLAVLQQKLTQSKEVQQ